MPRYADLSPDPWLSCRELATSYDGAATELWVGDCREDRLGRVVEGILERGAVEALDETYVGEDFNPSGSLAEAAERLLAGESCRLGIILRVGGMRLQVYADAPFRGLLWLEVVFWADLVFPAGAGEDAHRDSLVRLVQFALDLCHRAEARLVLLSTEFNGDPRELEGAAGAGLGWVRVLWARDHRPGCFR